MSRICHLNFFVICLSVLITIATMKSGPALSAAYSSKELQIFKSRIIDLLKPDSRAPLKIRQNRQELQSYYVDDLGEFLWLTSDRADQFIAILNDAALEGLNPNDYPVKQLTGHLQARDTQDFRLLALIELNFSAVLVQFIKDLKFGRLEKIAQFYSNHPKPNFDRNILKQIANYKNLRVLINDSRPKNLVYQQLQKKLAALQLINRQGRWQNIAHGQTLRPQDRDNRVRQVRRRLASEFKGLLKTSDQDYYDTTLASAVIKFQKTHQLPAKGIIGRRTIFALNVPITSRINQIEANLERLRWFERVQSRKKFRDTNSLLLNLARPSLEIINSRKTLKSFRVIADRNCRLLDPILHQLTNFWTYPAYSVPRSIAAQHILPVLKRSPKLISQGGYQIEIAALDTLPDRVDWNDYNSQYFPFEVTQLPGDRNALGQLSIELEKDKNLILHTIPKRKPFVRAHKALSQNCIGVRDLIAIVKEFLNDTLPGGSPTLERALKENRTKSFRMNDLRLLYVTYLSAWATDSGELRYSVDELRRDTRLLRQIYGRRFRGT